MTKVSLICRAREFESIVREENALTELFFFLLPAFTGEFRVDLQPRVTRDGRVIVDTSSLGTRQQAIVTLP